MINNKPTIVDLFCGCGGFGLGAELSGFHTIAAIDIDETLQSAYKKNFPNTNVINADLSSLGLNEWKNILDGKEVDGVIGGPPCQGYSRMGAGDVNDSRRLLIMDFFRHVNLLSPKFFVMENVEGLMDEKNIGQLNLAIDSIDKKYTVMKPILLDASEYGAPTKRRRVIIIGYDKKKMGSEINIDDFRPHNKKVTIKDAIWDIGDPIEKSKDGTDFGWAKYRAISKISEYAKMMRKFPPVGLGSLEALEKLSIGMISGNFITNHSETVRKRYESIEQEKIDPISKSKKLSWNGLCPTLRAGTGADKGSHQAVRPLHPEKGRVITVREAARLQGFPDWFCFHPAKWHSFRMIGNSVSPIISKAILSRIYVALKNQQI